MYANEALDSIDTHTHTDIPGQDTHLQSYHIRVFQNKYYLINFLALHVLSGSLVGVAVAQA